MSIMEIVKQMTIHASAKSHDEEELLQEIAYLSSPQFAEQATEHLHSKYNAYSFDVYLWLLGELKKLIVAGVESGRALAAIENGVSAGLIIEAERTRKENQKPWED